LGTVAQEEGKEVDDASRAQLDEKEEIHQFGHSPGPQGECMLTQPSVGPST
jgi:hypothetical protein